MIYFDNAATTLMKPPSVPQAVAQAITSFGGVGRGAHQASIAAGTTVYRARDAIASLFGCTDPRRVAFSVNATASLNAAIRGMLHSGDHAITTAASHNSVLRPLYYQVDHQGAELSVLPVARDASIDYDAYVRLFQPNTRLVVLTHASNVTGDVYDVARMARVAHEHGACVVLDCAQTAGSISVDMNKLGVDVAVFTGHKGLFGPQGTGGMCVSEHTTIPPFIVGGSGIRSYDRAHPPVMPEALEAGTLNAHGIAGLLAGVEYLQQTGIETLHERTLALTQRLEVGAASINGIKLYGGHAGHDRCGIVALNVGDCDSARVSDMLSNDYDIATRAGAHCAPLMHQALGTEHQGLVRMSLSSFNTEQEVDVALNALEDIAHIVFPPSANQCAVPTKAADNQSAPFAEAANN